MRFILKFAGIAAIAIFFASCYNDVPELPTLDKVDGYSYCQYKDDKGNPKCKSTYEISRKSCDAVGGNIVSKCENYP